MLKNIIIIQDFAHVNGGNANVSIQSAVELVHRGYHVVFFCGMSPIDYSLTQAGVDVRCVGKSDLISDGSAMSAFFWGLWDGIVYDSLKEVLCEFDPSDTLVHIHGWLKTLSPSIWKALSTYKYKCVVTLHDYFLFCQNGGLYNFRSNSVCELKPLSSSCLLCNCDSRSYFHKIWRDIRQYIQLKTVRKNSPFSVISIGRLNEKVSRDALSTYVDKWYRIQNPIDVNRRDFVKITENQYYMMVSRVSEEKGIRMFCQVITELNLKGCVIGDGPIRKQLSDKYPNIEFVGWTSGEQKDHLIRTKAKCLVYPSLWYEGSPLTTIELMSYGVPSIVSDGCAAAEQITDGKDGFLFKMGDREALKAALLKYEKSDLSVMQKYISEHFVAEDYSLQTHCDKLITAYTDILGN